MQQWTTKCSRLKGILADCIYFLLILPSNPVVRFVSCLHRQWRFFITILLQYQYKLCAYLFSFSAFKSRTCWSTAKHDFYVCYQVNSSQVAQKQNKTKQPKMICLALFRNQSTYTGPVSQSSYPVLNATLMPMSTEYVLPWKPDFDRQKTTDPV